MSEENIHVFEMETPVYDSATGQERLISNTQSPLQLFKGPEALIKERPLTDGALYFATDSKKIYLDCDFKDSEQTEWHDRLSFGGSSGIFFSQKEFDEMTTDFNFYFNEVEGVLDLITQMKLNVPKIDDIILDEANGTFYRVTSVLEDLEMIMTKKLVVAGGGGGGGEGGGGGGGSSAFKAQLLDRSLAFSDNAEHMFVRYVAYSPSDVEGYENQIDIEVYDRNTGTKLFTIENIVASGSATEVASTDIKPIIDNQLAAQVLRTNFLYTNLGFIFTDGTNRSAIQPVTSFAIVSVSLTPEVTDLSDYSTDAVYGIVPHFDSSLVRRATIEYTVTDQAFGTLYQEGIIENLSNNTASQVTLNYQAGRPVTIESKFVGYVNNTVKVTSAILTQSLMFIDPSSPIPRIVVLGWPSKNSYEAYTQEAIVSYRVTYGNAQVTYLEGHLIMYKQNDSNEWEVFSDVPTRFDIGTNLSWTVPFEQEGNYRLEIVVGSGASRQVAEKTVNGVPQVYAISGSSSTVPIVAAGAQFDFTPDRDETSSNKASWSTIWYNPDGRLDESDGRVRIIGDQEINAQFDNFNWTTNGWFGVEGTNKNKIVLNNGAKLILPVAPFYGEFSAADGSYNGASATGKTIEFDVKISNVRNRKKRIIDCSCYNTDITDWQNKDPIVGVIATGDYFVLTDSSLNILTTMQTEGIVNDTVNGLVAHYSADERVHICYVIARDNADIDARYPRGYIYTYVNGVLSGIVKRNESVLFRQGNSPKDIVQTVFDSTYADIEIYNYRFYGKALSSEAVLDNYLASTGDIVAATARKAANNVAEYHQENDASRNYSYIDLAKVMTSASIPYLVLRGGYRCDKKGTKMTQGEGNAEVSLPYFDKKDFRYMEAYFVDPDDFSRCFGIKDPIYNSNGKIINFTATSADRYKVLIYPQGTSSLEYPVKNLRMKVLNSNNANGKKNYQLFPNTAPCKVFTLKADYMDSSMCHNTGTANQLNDLYASAGITFDPTKQLRDSTNEYKDYDFLTAIRGRPIVIFYEHAGIKPGVEYTEEDYLANYEYIGRYNFNFDKSEAFLFGFFSDEENKYGIVMANQNEFSPGFEAVIKDDSDAYNPEITYYSEPILDNSNIWVPVGENLTEEQMNTQFTDYLAIHPLYVYKEVRNSIQCWEMKNNNNNLTSFRTPWDETYDRVPHPTYNPETGEKISDGSAYATWISGYESRYPEYVSEAASDKRAFSAFLNWVASTNLMTATNATLPEAVTYGSGVEARTYTVDSQEYRLAKFKNEIDQHMKKDFVAFYYIMTELEILMDSRAKNMMMVSYDADNETGAGHWYPIFYDMDTAMGVNNTGKLVYRYDEKDTNFGVYNTTADYPRIAGANPNGIEGIDLNRAAEEYSVLWANFRLAFAQGYMSEVAKLYRKMRQGNLNLNFLLSTYNNTLANAWNETFINHDEWYKYIRPKDQKNYLYDEKGNHVLIDKTKSADLESNWKLRDTNFADLLYAAQGTRSEHRKQWLRRRMLLLDGKYAADATAFRFKFRLNTIPEDSEHTNPLTYTLNMTADDTSYIWLNFNANSLASPDGKSMIGVPYGPLYIPEGQTISQTLSSANNSLPTQEQEGIILFCQNITSFGNMGRLGLANVGVDNNTGMTNIQFKLHDFNSSFTEYQQAQREIKSANPWSTFEGRYYPLLEHLNLDRMYSKMTNADLSTNTYLQTLTAAHSYLITITFPVGGVLNSITVPETLTTLKVINQPLLNTVVCDNNTWRDLNSLQINGCPLMDTKTIFKIGKRKVEKIRTIDLQDINWVLDPTDPEECTLDSDGHTIVDLPILNYLITTPGITASAPWSEEQNKRISISYYVGGTVRIDNGQNYGMDAVSIQEKYCGCFPKLNIVYEDNQYVTGAYTINYYDANKSIVPIYTKQYRMNAVAELTTADLFNHLNLALFGKQSEISHDYILVGFKIDSNDATDLYTESVKNQTPVVTYEEAYEQARAVADVYVDTTWTPVDLNAIYDSNTTYYTVNALYILGNSEYQWRPTNVDRAQDEFTEYLLNNDLYIYEGTSFTFRNDFALQADQQHKEVSFYPIYVAKVRRFRVYFYDSDDRTTAKILKSEVVRYQDAATLPTILPTKVVLNPNNLEDALIYNFDHYVGDNNANYSRVTEKQFQYPVFSSFGIDIRTIPANDEYFEASIFSFTNPHTSQMFEGTMLTLKDTYRQEAITIPTEYNNRPVLGLNSVKRSKQQIQQEIDTKTTALNNETNEETKAELRQEIATLQKTKEDTVDLHRVYFESSERNEGINSIRVIQNNAFTDNTSLEYFELEACTNLNAISVNPNGGTFDRSKGTFSGCTNLQILSLPSQLSIIGTGCFNMCTSLSLDHFPSSIAQFGTGCFYKCTGLGQLSIGVNPKVTQIDNRAFWGCSNLEFEETDCNFPYLRTIGEYAFENCSKLAFLTDEEKQNSSIEIIGRNAFSGCTAMCWATMPSQVTAIGNYAFSGVTKLTCTTMPASLLTIGNSAFAGVSFYENPLNGGLDFNVSESPNAAYSIHEAAFANAKIRAIVPIIPATSSETTETILTKAPWSTAPWGAVAINPQTGAITGPSTVAPSHA